MAASLRLYRLWQARCFRSNNKSFFPQIEQPNEGHGRLIFEVFGLHTMTHYSRFDSSGRGIGQSLRPVPDNTQHSQQTDIHACGGGVLFGVFSCTLSVPQPYLVLCLHCPAFCHLSLLTTHNTNIHAPRRGSNPQAQQASNHRSLCHWARQDSNLQYQEASDRRPSP